MEPKKTIFTKAEIILAILLSIFINTVLWGLGILIGSILLHPVDFLYVMLPLFAIGSWILKKIENRRLQTILISVVLALLVGKMYRYIGLPFLILILCIFLGGIVTGSIRYKDYLEPMKKKLIKYGFLVLLVLSTSASVFLGLRYYAISIDIPIDYLQPPKVAEGWIYKGETSSFFQKEVNYQKGISSLQINWKRIPQSPRTKEECKNIIGFGLKTLELTDITTDMTAKLTREELIEVNGYPRYVLRYDFVSKGKDFPLKAWISYFWYCVDLKTNVRALAMINNTPVENYISEVEEMVVSLKCQ